MNANAEKKLNTVISKKLTPNLLIPSIKFRKYFSINEINLSQTKSLCRKSRII